MSTQVARLNTQELARNTPDSASWHRDYADTAWVYVGGLPKELSEGDLICLMSQFGEVEDVDMPRDESTGEPKGHAFVKFEDWRSSVLTVDNFEGIVLLGRTLRLDHARPKKIPNKVRTKGNVGEGEDGRKGKTSQIKELQTMDRLERAQPGFKYKDQTVEGEYSLNQGMDVFAERRKAVEKDEEAGGASWKQPEEIQKDKILKKEEEEERKHRKHHHNHRRRSPDSGDRHRSRRGDDQFQDSKPDDHRQNSDRDRRRDFERDSSNRDRRRDSERVHHREADQERDQDQPKERERESNRSKNGSGSGSRRSNRRSRDRHQSHRKRSRDRRRHSPDS